MKTNTHRTNIEFESNIEYGGLLGCIFNWVLVQVRIMLGGHFDITCITWKFVNVLTADGFFVGFVRRGFEVSYICV